MILIIKSNPTIKANIESIFNFSLERNGIGMVSAKYKLIRELFTTKRVLNFSIIFLKDFQSGNLKLFIFNFAPILCAQAYPLKATAFKPCPGKHESPTQ